MKNPELNSWLSQLAESLISDLTASDLDINEGIVMSSGTAPYRRLDCDGRALAYIRSRPKKRALRVDVTGLWRTPRGASRIRIPNSGGSTTFLLRTQDDLSDAVRFLRKTIEKTRDANKHTNKLKKAI